MQYPCATHLTQAGTQKHGPDPAKDRVHHRESDGLSYGAIFGWEVEDVADWRRIAVKFVDGLKVLVQFADPSIRCASAYLIILVVEIPVAMLHGQESSDSN